MNQLFIQKLKENNWQEIQKDWEYRKGSWIIWRDTGSWWIIDKTPFSRIFDFPEPTDYTVNWTVNLIEHLCSLNDQLENKL